VLIFNHLSSKFQEFVSVLAFSKFKTTATAVDAVTSLVQNISKHMEESSPLFQNAFARSMKTLIGPNDTLLVSIETSRIKSRMVDYEVINNNNNNNDNNDKNDDGDDDDDDDDDDV
jgi:phosphopantothenoylcysteine synthetase/decarboxylase